MASTQATPPYTPTNPLTPHHLHNRSKQKRSDKQFQTKFALVGTSCTLLLLLVLAVSFSEWRHNEHPSFAVDIDINDVHLNEWNEYQHGPLSNQSSRRLDETTENTEQSNNNDYSTSRCQDIFSIPANNQCIYAQTCDDNTGLLLPFLFCSSTLPIMTWLSLLSPFLLILLTLLFRLLGSTADEYFSPSLEMFSLQMGLPPRFAGVTLLALGNGAADVSATINAIVSDPEYGYQMSLGALSGAAMFITTCIVGAVVVVNDGVRCRGAAVRDVMGLGVTVLVVGGSLGRGEVDRKVRVFAVWSSFVYILFRLRLISP